MPTRRGAFLMVELGGALVVAGAILAVAMASAQGDRLARERERDRALVEQVQNLLQRARHGIDDPPPAGWRWQREVVEPELELVALVDADGRRFATLRRRR